MYKQFLEQPSISTAYQCMDDSGVNHRITMANIFLSAKEYHINYDGSLAKFDIVENILKSKVLTYAIAFAGGATNGGLLYQQARADLLTWRSIFDNACFAGGWLTDGI